MNEVIEVLKKYGFRFDILGEKCLRVYYKDGTGDYCGIEPCDDERPGYYSIAGRVQNLNEWINRQI